MKKNFYGTIMPIGIFVFLQIDNNRSGFLWEFAKCTKAYRNEERYEEKILGNDYAGGCNQHSILCQHYGAGKHRAGGAGGDCRACVGSYNVKRERLLSRCFFPGHYL